MPLLTLRVFVTCKKGGTYLPIYIYIYISWHYPPYSTLNIKRRNRSESRPPSRYPFLLQLVTISDIIRFTLTMKCNYVTAYTKQIKLHFHKRTHCIISDSDLHYTPKTNKALECVQRVTDRKRHVSDCTWVSGPRDRQCSDTMLLNSLII